MCSSVYHCAGPPYSTPGYYGAFHRRYKRNNHQPSAHLHCVHSHSLCYVSVAAMASCSTVRCKDRQACLTEVNTGSPRCVTCSYRCPRPRSPSGMRRDMGGPICGTNNRTYHSWCHMLKDACATGFVIETKFSGTCDVGGMYV